MSTQESPQPAAPSYPSDVTEAEWRVLAASIPPGKHGGRPRAVEMRAVINGIFYVLRSGCAWRMLPHDFPPWPTVYYYFWSWRRDGTWERLQDTLRDQVRAQAGRELSPSAAIIDSQSVKTTEKGGLAATTPARK
jgi:putative transposase